MGTDSHDEPPPRGTAATATLPPPTADELAKVREMIAASAAAYDPVAYARIRRMTGRERPGDAELLADAG